MASAQPATNGGRAIGLQAALRMAGAPGGQADGMFLFFSSRLGCLGSLAVSLILTLVVLVLLGVL